MEKQFSVYVVDDHPLVTEAICSVVRSLSAFKLVGSSETSAKALDEILASKPDIVVLDIIMPDISGIEILNNIKEKLPSTKTIVFTGCVEEDKIKDFLIAGANAYILKGSSMSELIDAFNTVAKGNYYFDKEVGKILTTVSCAQSGVCNGEDNFNALVEKYDLSAREISILKKILDGASCSKIAEELEIKLSSVYTYRSRLMKKIGVESISELFKVFLKK